MFTTEYANQALLPVPVVRRNLNHPAILVDEQVMKRYSIFLMKRVHHRFCLRAALLAAARALV
jgi:hypothetical protein